MSVNFWIEFCSSAVVSTPKHMVGTKEIAERNFKTIHSVKEFVSKMPIPARTQSLGGWA